MQKDSMSVSCCWTNAMEALAVSEHIQTLHLAAMLSTSNSLGECCMPMLCKDAKLDIGMIWWGMANTLATAIIYAAFTLLLGGIRDARCSRRLCTATEHHLKVEAQGSPKEARALEAWVNLGRAPSQKTSAAPGPILAPR